MRKFAGIQQKRTGSHCSIVYEQTTLIFLPLNRHTGENLRNCLRCVEFSGFLARFTRKLSDKIFIRIAQHIAVIVEQIHFVDFLDKLRNCRRLLLLTCTKTSRVQIHISEKISENRVGLFNIVECLFEHLTLKCIVIRCFCQFCIGQLRLNRIVIAFLDVLEQVVSVFCLVSLLVSSLCLGHALGLFIIQQVVDVRQKSIGKILIKNYPKKIVFVFVSIHFSTQNVCTSPKNA